MSGAQLQSLQQLREFPGYANKSNPMHRAAAQGDTAFLQTLSDHLDLSKIRMRDALGATPLHVAAREGRCECLEWLLEHTRLSVRDKASAGETPLHVAAARGHLSLLQLLARHAAPDSPEERARVLLTPDSNELTALHLAALKGHQAVVNWIVMEYKSYLSPLMETGRVTPAHLAASAGHLEILRTLLSSANRFNGWAEARDTEGTPVAYFAAQEGRLECVRFLLEELSVDPRALCTDGMSALHAAAQSGHDAIVRYYVERLGSDVIRWTTEDRGIPLHFAASLGHSSTVVLLLGYDETGTTHSQPDDKSMTPLHEAVLMGRVECARVLVEAGAYVRAEDSEGRSPFSIVSQDKFHTCHDVVMHAVEDPISEHCNEEPVRHRIPKARSGYQESHSDAPIIPESEQVLGKIESFNSNESKVLSSHSSETTPLPSSASEDPVPVPRAQGTPDRRKSFAEQSYSLSALLDDNSPSAPIDKFLVGMDHRTARRQLRWLSRSVPLAPSLPLPTAAPPHEEPSPAEHTPPQQDPPRRQLSSLVLERMTLLGGAPRSVAPSAELSPVSEEREAPEYAGLDRDNPGIRMGMDLPGDLPVSEELRFFYGQESEEAMQSDSGSTLQSADPPAVELAAVELTAVELAAVELAAVELTAVETSSEEATQSTESRTEQMQSVQSELSLQKLTNDFIDLGPSLALPAQETLASDLQSEERPKRGLFSGLKLIGRLLGRREREEESGDGGAAFEAIMQRNLIIQEQIRSAPFPHLPPGLLEPVSTSTAVRAPGLPPAWQPEALLAEEQSFGSPAPPSSTTDSLPDPTARLIRPSAGQFQTRPISTTIAIETTAPHVLSDTPPSSFTEPPQEPTPGPRPPAEVRNPETQLDSRAVSSRIANLTHSLLGSAVPVLRPYSQENVYAKLPADRPINPAERLITPAERPIIPAERPIIPAERPIIPAERPIIPAERLIIPAERPIKPADRPIIPAERPIIPAERLIIPAERPIKPADRPIIPAERPIIPAERLIIPVEMPTIPAERPIIPAARPISPAATPLQAEAALQLTRPHPESDPASKESASRGATSSYDVPSWEETREYLRRVTARQRRRPAEEEEPAVPAVAGTASSQAQRDEQRNDSLTTESEVEPVPELPPLTRSPALPDLSNAASEPLKDRATSPARRKLTPGPSTPSAGPSVSQMRERFSLGPPARPQHLRISALKRETLASPPKPVPTFPARTERLPAPVRAVKSSDVIAKLPALAEEAPDASQMLRDMFLLSGRRTEHYLDTKDAVPAPTGAVPSGSVTPVGAGAGAGEGSIRTEVQELSVSGQVRDRLRLFS